MAFITTTPSGKWRANWRDPAGNQRAKTFRTKREAKTFVAQIETDMAHGSYVSPHSGRVPFRDYAQRWMESWTTERTTAARDESIMRNHVLPQWGDGPLGNIDHMAVQTWVSDLTDSLAHATIVECHRLTSAVLRSAVQNKMIQHNPCEGVRLPKRQKRGQRIMNRTDVLDKLLPVIPEYYKGVVATAAGTGLRWGEIAALCTDAVDLDNATLTVKRTVIEVKGHTSFKAIPKTTAGIRTVPLPSWLVAVISDHVATWPPEEGGLIFPNTVGKPLRRTLFRTRVWKPSLVRAGLLGHLTPTDTAS
ncbi:tyrosine-type recombinase/integrase [Salinifilum ghardaiensis]